MKKTVILADKDQLYLKKISDYFMEKAPQLELNIFTDLAGLLAYLDKKPTIDIMVVSEEMADSEVSGKSKDAVKVLLSSSMNPVEGYVLVKKYQRTQDLLNQILFAYAENSGQTDAIRGQSNTRIAAFFSPVGGSGKTTLALALATAMAAGGRNVFYLNMEEISSVDGILPATSGCLSDVFLTLKAKNMDPGLRLAGCIGMVPGARFSCLSGVESVSEYGELQEEELQRMFDAIRGLAEFDFVIVDMSSGFSKLQKGVLSAADCIFVPILPDGRSIAKISRLLRETELHTAYNSYFEKMRLIINRSETSGAERVLGGSEIQNMLPCCCAVGSSPLLASPEAILQSGNLLCAAMDPLVRELQTEQTV